MPQIVSGQSGYLGGETGGTGNGVGAVIFDKPDDSGSQMLFRAIENNARQYNQEQLQRKKENNEKQLAMLQGIDLDTKGVFESDLPMFQEAVKGVSNEYGKLLSDFNGDLSSVPAMQRMNQIKQQQALHKLNAEQSATDKNIYTQRLKEMYSNPKKYDIEKSLANLEAFAKKPLGQRGDSELLVEKPPQLLTLMQNHLKDVGDDTEISEPYTNEFGKVGMRTIKGKSPEKLNQFYQMAYQTDSEIQKQADEDYAQLPADIKLAIETERVMSGKENVPPSQLWLGKVAEQFATSNKGYKGLGNNPYVMNALKKDYASFTQAQKDEHGSIIFENFANVANGEPTSNGVELTGMLPNGQAHKVQYNPMVAKMGVFSVGKDANGKPINADNTFLGTLVEDAKIGNGQTKKIVRKLDTQTLFNLGIIAPESISQQGNVVTMSSLSPQDKAKIYANLDKFPPMTTTDVIVLTKANGGTEAGITKSVKKYNANAEGGYVDLSKVAPRKTEVKINAGELKREPVKNSAPKVEQKQAPKVEVKKKIDLSKFDKTKR